MADHSAERIRINAVPSAWQPLIQQKITIESRWTDFIELGAYLAMLSGIALLSWGLIRLAIQIVLSKSIELPEFYESRSFYFFTLQFPYLLGWFLISTRDKKAADQDLRVRKSVRFLIVVALGCFFILANLEVTHPTRFNSRILNVDKRVWGMLSLLLDYSLLLIHVLQIDLLRAICQKIALPQMASRFRWLFFVISVPIAVLLLILMLISSDRSLISRFQINSLISENRQFSPQHWPLVRIVFKLFFSIWIISELVYLVSFVSFCFQLRKQSGKVFRESAQKSNTFGSDTGR